GGHAEKANLPRLSQPAERLREHLDVFIPPEMVLVDIDVVGSQTPQTRLAVVHDQLGIGVWVGHRLILTPEEANLRGDEDFVAGYGSEEACQDLLAVSEAVLIGGVVEVHAELPGALQCSQRLAVVDRSP